MTSQGATTRRGTVRLERQRLGLEPSLDLVVRAIAGLERPFVLQGRWGLPASAPATDRVLIAGAQPRFVVEPRSGDPFAPFDEIPQLLGDAPSGAVGGGLVGWLGFDLGRAVEATLGPQPRRPQPLPAAPLAWYDDVLRRDQHGVWWVEVLVEDQGRSGDRPGRDAVTGTELELAAGRWRERLAAASGDATTPPAALGTVDAAGVSAAHEAAVAETIDRIHAGELFQANVCLRLETTLDGPASSLVAPVLTETDPWFGAWIDAGDGRSIVSASPELFLRRRGRDVTTGPIKGTAPRRDAAVDPVDDPAAAALLHSAKDHAEHVMIVDLMRNDLGRACDYGSIWWNTRPRLEPHAGVWHLVSQVGGRLHDGLGDRSLLRATFPPGSVTGAPKVQAMRVISAVEGTGREVYTGAHGIAGPAIGLELAVTIRTIELSEGRAWIGAGGGIVADSRPADELDEALGKAAALIRAAGGSLRSRPARVAGAGDGSPSIAGSAVGWMRSGDRRPDPSAGLLETMRVDEGRALHLDGHLARLAHSLRTLGYPGPPADLRHRVEAMAATAVAPARLRLLASAAGDRLDVELQLVPIMATGPGTGPVTLAPVVVPGGIGPHKFLDRTLIDALTLRVGATPLLTDADGSVMEAGWANLWWIDDDGLATTALDGRILPGVTRAALLARAPEAPLPVREARIGLGGLAGLPLLLTSARGVSVARLATTPPQAMERATRLATALGPLVAG